MNSFDDNINVPPSPALSADERLRYSRHLLLPQLGEAGQLKLKQARVLVVGMGGLGTIASQYLAGAGVGTLGLVDFDAIDLSNLQRQLLYETGDVGRSKVESAQQRLARINPEIRVVGFEKKLSPENAIELFSNFDLVLDGTDNFGTRYLINDACAKLEIPNLFASLSQFEGRLSVFDVRRGPCYRCLFPEPPPAGQVKNCAEAGVLGVLPGLAGIWQATEALKLILEIGEPLIGKVLLFDILQSSFQILHLEKRKDCLTCGEKPTYPGLTRQTLEGSAPSIEPDLILSPQDFLKRQQQGESWALLDVRETFERNLVHLGGTLIPLGELPMRYRELDPNQNLAVYCHHGVRSLHAVQFLRSVGFTKAKSLAGGVDRWSLEIDRTLTRY